MEDDYLDVLRATGNLTAAARAVGISTSVIWQRRRDWPGFRARLEETLEEAALVLEFRLAAHGTNVGVGPGGEARAAPLRPGAAVGTVTVTVPDEKGDSHSDCPQAPFDPEFALRFLRWREEKKRGGGQRGRVPAPPDIEAVTERIIRKVEAIKRHRAKGGRLDGDSQQGDRRQGDSQQGDGPQ